MARLAKDLAGGPQRIGPAGALRDAPIIAEHRSALWVDGRADEFILRCGKVQNLRIAIAGFQGIEVSAGRTLSFWAQVGRPAASRGFVVGREIVNGCVVPTIGGGLCQLSNSLAALAMASGARLIERHQHSALIEAQSPPAEDATVAWNYVDLRIQADFAFRIEAELTQDELLLQMRALRPNGRAAAFKTMPVRQQDRAVARGCLTCNERSCFRHKPQTHPLTGRSALLLTDKQAELAHWVERSEVKADWMVPRVRKQSRDRTWNAPPGVRVETALWPVVKRALRQRLLHGEGAERQALRLQSAKDLALHYARRLQADHTELLVTQELLVPLWRAGVLGGRAFDVYVSELPASELQSRLDAAAAKHPTAASLRDFRVDASWQKDEWKALARARRRITPHHEVRRVLRDAGLEVDLLPWDLPAVARTPSVAKPGRLTLTFAASALARKGAIEVSAVARMMNARVLILGSPPSDPSLWEGVEWSQRAYASDWLALSDLVLLPAFVEHHPRALLLALAAGIPVVASPACGLGPRAGLIEVPPGDLDSLAAAIRDSLVRPLRTDA